MPDPGDSASGAKVGRHWTKVQCRAPSIRTNIPLMKQSTLNVISSALFPAMALLAVASCSSDSDGPQPTTESTSTTTVKTGVPGGTVVETFTVTANVTRVDADAREVTLLTSDGKKHVVKCGPQVVNFDQIRVGDQLKVTMTESLAIHMADEADEAAPTSGAATMVELAPKGAKPGGLLASTVQEVATVTAIDVANHKATLQFSDGTTQTISVRKDVDLTKRKVGEKVVIRVTDAMALSVEKQQ